VILRPAALADLDAVAHIWLDGWRSTGIALAVTPTIDVLRPRIAREVAGGWVVTVAEVDGAVAGFVAVSLSIHQLEQLFVDPARQRSGIGAALLAHAHTAMPGGFGLWTHIDNVGAARFYARQGMALVGPGVHPTHGHGILTFAMPTMAA